MKIEEAKQIATKAIEELSQALEAGHSEKLREYLGAMARFHRYSWHNVMLIASQRPDATHVAGFKHLEAAWALCEERCEGNHDPRSHRA